MDAPLFDRDLLKSGQHIDGPAVVSESTATTVIEAGWRGTLTEQGNLVLKRIVPRPRPVGDQSPARGRRSATSGA